MFEPGREILETPRDERALPNAAHSSFLAMSFWAAGARGGGVSTQFPKNAKFRLVSRKRKLKVPIEKAQGGGGEKHLLLVPLRGNQLVLFSAGPLQLVPLVCLWDTWKNEKTEI